MRVVFMGTPEFSVGALKALYNAGHEIVAVFTQPDKPKGRKMILTAPPVKTVAEELNIPVFQPKSVKTEEAYELVESFNADVIVVVAYGKILPTSILNVARYGCINIHASVLPRHRGAAPIQWSIVSGDRVTGVTTMQMDEGIDTGDILQISQTPISNDDDGGTLHDRLSLMGAELICKTLEAIENGEIAPQKQDDSLATYAPIITREMGKIDFSKTAEQIHNLVRGFTPWPAAYTFLNGKRLKVYKTEVASIGTNEQPGTVVFCDKKIIVSCGEYSAIELIDVQLEGKSRMTADVLLNGNPIEKGTKLGE